MRLLDIANRAGRSLRQAKARTILTSLAIAVGAFSITLSLAAGDGGRNYTDQIVMANTDKKELTVSKATPFGQNGPKKYNASTVTGQINPFLSGEVLTQTDIDKVSALPEVKTVQPVYSLQIKYITAAGKDKFTVPITSTYNPNISVNLAAGDLSKGLADDEVILTDKYIKALDFKSDSEAIGKTVDLVVDKQAITPGTLPESKTYSFTIKAVTNKSGLAFRTQSSILLPEKTVKEIYDYATTGTAAHNKFFALSVHVKNETEAQPLKDKLEKDSYEVSTAADILGTINTFINVLQGILLGFGLLAILTSVFGIINTQYISVLERTQQIGLMKALGMRGKDVGRLFKLEAALIGLLGGLIGCGSAVILGTALNPVISKALDIGDIYLLIFDPLKFAAILLGLMIVAVSAGILPARKAARLNPIEALRTE